MKWLLPAGRVGSIELLCRPKGTGYGLSGFDSDPPGQLLTLTCGWGVAGFGVGTFVEAGRGPEEPRLAPVEDVCGREMVRLVAMIAPRHIVSRDCRKKED